MTPQPDDHTLNACLARVIGVKLQPHPSRKLSPRYYWVYSGGLWDPLHDANQMEEIEAWLVENGYEFGSAWSKSDGYYMAHVLLDPNTSGDPRILYRTAMGPDKKRAFALAIWQMEQSDNNNNKED